MRLLVPGSLVASMLLWTTAGALGAQLPADLQDSIASSAAIGREAVESLQFPPLVFDPPEVAEYEIDGVPVFHLRDSSLPLVDVRLQVLGGTSYFPRERLGAVSAFPFLLRAGGTRELPPDSIDRRIDLLALQLTFGSGG